MTQRTNDACELTRIQDARDAARAENEGYTLGRPDDTWPEPTCRTRRPTGAGSRDMHATDPLRHHAHRHR
jgi:hypothetical protein